MRRSDKYRVWVILAVLVALQFSVRNRLGNERTAPSGPVTARHRARATPEDASCESHS